MITYLWPYIFISFKHLEIGYDLRKMLVANYLCSVQNILHVYICSSIFGFLLESCDMLHMHIIVELFVENATA